MQCCADIVAKDLIHPLRPMVKMHEILPHKGRIECRQMFVFRESVNFRPSEGGHVFDVFQRVSCPVPELGFQRGNTAICCPRNAVAGGSERFCR